MKNEWVFIKEDKQSLAMPILFLEGNYYFINEFVPTLIPDKMLQYPHNKQIVALEQHQAKLRLKGKLVSD